MAPRTIEAVAPIVDISDASPLAVHPSSLTFLFDTIGEPDPEFQDVVFSVTGVEAAALDDIVWTSQDELGDVVPLRIPQRMLLASAGALQRVSYGSVTLEPPEDIAFPIALETGEEIVSIADIGNSSFLVGTAGGGRSRLIQFTLNADGSIASSQVLETY